MSRKLQESIYTLVEADQSSHRSNLVDPVRLNKVLWYADVAAYLRWGRSITGAEYIRKPLGPVPSGGPRAIKELQRERILMKGKGNETGFWHRRLDLVGEMQVKALTGEEQDLLRETFGKVMQIGSSQEVSERTHGDSWEKAEDGQVIPLHSVFAERLDTVTVADLEWGRRVVREAA